MKKEQAIESETIPVIATEDDCQLFVKYKPEASRNGADRVMAERRTEEILRRSRRFSFWELLFFWRRRRQSSANKAET